MRCGWCKSPYWNQPKKKESHASLEDRGSQKGSVAVRRSGDKVGTAVGRGESVVRVQSERAVEESISGPDEEFGGDEEAIDDPEPDESWTDSDWTCPKCSGHKMKIDGGKTVCAGCGRKVTPSN